MKLVLSELPESVLGIYGVNKDKLGKHQRFMHPEAAKAFMKLEVSSKRLRVSDMFRSAEASLLARSQKSGVQPPAKSAHNFGLAIDIDVSDCMKRLNMTKQQLDIWLESEGWFCHRKDHLIKSEAWHFNWLGPDPQKYLKFQTSNRAACVEARINDLYGKSFILNPIEIQEALKELKMYSGPIDGDIGPLTQESVKAFQRTWKVLVTGQLDAATMRLLAYVTADREIVSL